MNVNVIGLIIEITGWMALAMSFVVVCVLHHATKRVLAERKDQPIRDLDHRF